MGMQTQRRGWPCSVSSQATGASSSQHVRSLSLRGRDGTDGTCLAASHCRAGKANYRAAALPHWHTAALPRYLTGAAALPRSLSGTLLLPHCLSTSLAHCRTTTQPHWHTAAAPLPRCLSDWAQQVEARHRPPAARTALAPAAAGGLAPAGALSRSSLLSTSIVAGVTSPSQSLTRCPLAAGLGGASIVELSVCLTEDV